MEKLILSAALACAFFSCSEDADVVTKELNESAALATTVNQIHSNGVFINNEDSILSFSSFDEFYQVAEALKNSSAIETSPNKLSPVTDDNKRILIRGFKSIYNDYEEAMNEADNYYDSMEHYYEFKEKHPTLFFPEYENDYSAYLPVSNKYVAQLLNINGDVKIGGEIVNMKDVNSYEQLVELGEAMPEYDISTYDYTGDYLNGTPELKNGGDRKLKIRVYCEPGSEGVYQAIVVDVSFRKKGAFGAWYNYKSNTTLGWVGGQSWSKSGFSSHDYKFARIYSNGPVPFKGRMYLDFQGFRGERVFFNVNI